MKATNILIKISYCISQLPNVLAWLMEKNRVCSHLESARPLFSFLKNENLFTRDLNALGLNTLQFQTQIIFFPYMLAIDSFPFTEETY